MSCDLVIHGANEVFAVGETDVEVIEDGAVAIDDGVMVAAGEEDDVLGQYPVEDAEVKIDASGKTVLPGFVDPHTHAVFSGDRSDEFEAKIEGKSYQEIAEEGGGIGSTVDATRDAGGDELLSNLLNRLDRMLEYGSTTVEVKSGYGLDVETELRLLEVIEEADARHPVDVLPTYMGAHAVPPGTDVERYVDDVVENQLPDVGDQGIAVFCDVFCEKGYFDVEESRRILEAGMEYGLEPKVHADELSRLGGAELAAELGAVSADHLLHATEEDAEAMADNGVTPVLLPGTAFSLDAEYVDPEVFYDAGCDIAVATDFNPNCHSHSMSFAVTLSCVEMGMTVEDALVAATRNASRALDRHDRGLLAEGKPADIQVVDAPNHVHVPYSFGVNLVETVVKDGKIVYRSDSVLDDEDGGKHVERSSRGGDV
ncbi:MAG: imidazolonepropionase [Halobacteria archaeon]